MANRDRRIYTLGHGERELKAFLSLLLDAGIETLLDVRAQPAADELAHFSMEPLRQSLDDIGITYHWAGRHLGGGRAARQESEHIALADPALRGFADHMHSPQFITAIRQLQNLATDSNTVILSIEPEPARCHRRLIADHLLLQGWTVLHLLDVQREVEHLLSPEARRESIELIYDRYRAPRA